MNRREIINAGLFSIGGAGLAPALIRPAAAQADAGWTTLFDGINLDNWSPIGTANWKLVDGALVADNGNGFDPADREKIFGMSYQGLDKTKHKSPGAGLTIVKRIMEIHGGFIMADSIPGEGSALTCYFPA